MKIIVDSKVFVKSDFRDEQELENVVKSHYEVIFNEDVIYIPQKFIQTSGGFGTVPEAIVIDFSTGSWYIVEAELAKHGLWSHIIPQVHKQIAAAENPDVKQEIKRVALQKLEERESLKKKLIERRIPEIRIHEVIEKILESKPKVVIPIDGVPTDFEQWARTLSYDVILHIIEKCVEVKTGNVAYVIKATPFVASDKDDVVPPPPPPPISEEEFLKRCEKPGRILYQRLKKLAKEKNHEWKAGTQAFSYYVVSKRGKFCALTLWPTGLTILKVFMENRKEIPREALSMFRDKIIKISDLATKYDAQKMPGISTRKGDLTENEIDSFIAAFKELLGSITDIDEEKVVGGCKP